MDETRIRGASVAVLGIFAVVLTAAAATPLFAVQHGGDGPQGIEVPTQDRAGDISLPGIGTVQTSRLLAAVVFTGAIAVTVQFVSDPWATLKRLLGTLVGVAVLGALLHPVQWLFRSERSPVRPPPASAGETGPLTGEGFGSGPGAPLAVPVDQLPVVILGIAVVGAVLVLAWRSDTVRSTVTRSGDSPGPPSEQTVSAVGRLADQTADRVDTAPTPHAADNAIYRAWFDMIALLSESDPTRTTPRQFEAAAIEAGMPADAVSELTTVFEAVRYGEASLSPERRARAVEAFRCIASSVDVEAGTARPESGGEGTTLPSSGERK